MLNISLRRVTEKIVPERFDSLRLVERKSSGRVVLRLLGITTLVGFLLLFLPWTQNIRAYGKVTTLDVVQRPQTVQSTIDGRIERWYVREGDRVAAGDTILHLSEIKAEYLDPNLIERTQTQLEAKNLSTRSYEEKANALEARMTALRRSAELKLEQARNKLRQANLKVASDSIDLAAAVSAQTAEDVQLERMETLQQQGLKSLTDLENRRVKQQEVLAKRISAENKLLVSRNEVINATVELEGIRAKLADDLAKARSDRFSSLSSAFNARAEASKLENQVSSYEVRNGMYFVRAPQDGYVTKALRAGIGETIKAGEELISVMPQDYQLAVEMYIAPIDLPLLRRGERVNIQFEGWPAIVFSGWPNTSFGTFEGEVVAIDNLISDNGKYRVLVQPDADAEPWPEALRVGAGARALTLLQDVPVWYELWRQLNGFPPDLTETGETPENGKKS